jgi:hypothetical protein
LISDGQTSETTSPSGRLPVRRSKISPAAEPADCSSRPSCWPSMSGMPTDRDPDEIVR